MVADALTRLAAKKRELGATELRTVVCGRNRLENGSMAAWARAYAAHGGVRTVKMVQNGIRQEGITVLLREGLSEAKGLRVLDLQDNTFTEMGARALGDVVGGWEGIQELAVSDCYLKPRGANMLFAALRQGAARELEVLRLQYNDIDAKGVKALADTLDALPKLRRIELNGNKFAEEDTNIERISETLTERREAAGVEDAEDENWGLDELDELEDDDDEDEEDEGVQAAEDEEEEKERVVKDADEAEEQNVPQQKDKSVDQLADMLGKTGI